MKDNKDAYQSALEGAGVPANLAAQCAEIVASDDPDEPNLGRTEQDQHLIDSAMTWMEAQGFFSR